MTFEVVREDGTIVQKGDVFTSMQRNDASSWVYLGVWHPRKVSVRNFDDRTWGATYYASVFNVGIRDTDTQEWTFAPSWDKP